MNTDAIYSDNCAIEIMDTIQSNTYNIYFENSLNELAKFIDNGKYSKFFILTDENTGEHCLPLVKEAIGDRAFEQRTVSSYHYDLGEAWKLHTGLPFVFAAWIANKKLDTGFIKDFNKATGAGLLHLEEVIAQNPSSLFDIRKYYTQHISYQLTDEKRKGLGLFLRKLAQMGNMN